MQVDDISQVAQDFLKAIWSATEWGEPAITTTALAARFGTTPASVSDTLRRLDRQGLIVHQPYRPVQLTDDGHRLALAMVRRHRLLETFLVTTLGYTWDEVHDDAERLEHAVSPLLLDRIDALLGHPEADPHGDPIPREDGSVAHPEDALLLSEAPAGRYRVVQISDADPAVLSRLGELGLGIGSTVTVDSAAAFFDGSALDTGLTAIRVRQR